MGKIVGEVCVGAADGRYSKLGNLGLRVEEGQQSRRMQSAC